MTSPVRSAPPFVRIAAALSLLAAGCESASTSAKPNPGKTTAAASPTAASSANECEGTLASIDEIFNLSRLERTTSISDGVLRLNDWQRSCAPSNAGVAPLPDEIRNLLSEAQIRSLEEKRFTLRDGEHLRDCLVERTISRHALGEGKSELERATHLFGHLVRAIGVASSPPQDFPLTSYEVYLFGQGTVEDRTWLFVNVLRQLRIDAVLLYPNTGDAGTAAAVADSKYLIGVLLENQVYLFDPQAGLPIPAPAGDGAAAKARVATLAQAVADPAVLKQLDDGSDRRYPITAIGLRHPRVTIAGDADFWSARMQALQTQFVGDRAMVIADPLQDSGNSAPGLWNRLVKAGGEHWQPADVRVWDHADNRLAAHVDLTRLQQDTLIGLMRPFGAYKTIDWRSGQPKLVDREEFEDPAARREKQLGRNAGEKLLHPGVHMNVRVTAGEQMRARQMQMEGDYAQAVQIYTNVRSKSKDVLRVSPAPGDRIMHVRAIDDAVFWTGLCQFEQHEYKSAVNTFQRYRKQPDSEKWARETRYLLALSLAETGDTAAAIAELEPVPPDDLEYLGYRWLIRRWREGKGE